MKRLVVIFVLSWMLIPLWGCGGTPEKATVTEPRLTAPADVKIKVGDVSNDTKELFDVDVIGMLWTALDESLRQRDLLWTSDSPVPPLKLEVHIVDYQKGNFWLRPVLPMWGNSVLAVKCDLKDGDRLIVSAEARQSLSIASGGFTMNAWRQVFVIVADEIVTELVSSM